jgi:hypothetical protein
MVGRASLIVILGFSVIFGMASLYWNRESDSATNNMVDYYSASAAHNIAVGAANYAVSLIFQNTADTSAIDGMSGQFPGGGTYDITDQMLAGPYGTRDPYITTTGAFTGGDGVGQKHGAGMNRSGATARQQGVGGLSLFTVVRRLPGYFHGYPVSIATKLRHD